MARPTRTTLSRDEQRLAELGYKQELKRGWSSFSNFAISFSIISVLAGCFTSYGQAFNNGGPVAISIGWPVISLLILCVAFSMSELASAFPTAGGIYYWASKLGGAGLGLVHRLVQPDRPRRGRRLGRLRGGELPPVPARSLQRPLHLQLRLDERPLRRPRGVRAVRAHPPHPRADQRLLRPPGVDLQRHLGVVARDRRRGHRGPADRRARATTRASPTCSATAPTASAASATACTGSTCCRSASC